MRFKTYLNEKSYFGNQAVGVVLKCYSTGRILVVKRAKKVMEGGTYSITISGKVDSGESVEQAAYREIKEELHYNGGVSLKIMDVFQDSNDMKGFEGQFTFFTYIGFVKHEFTPVLNWESRSAFWWDGMENIKGTLHSGTNRLLRKYKRKIFK